MVRTLTARRWTGLDLSGLTELSDGGLTSLSDAAAESFSKHKGYLDLNGLTTLSDAAAESLAKKEPKIRHWLINLDNLPASAAKILRDAGHG